MALYIDLTQGINMTLIEKMKRMVDKHVLSYKTDFLVDKGIIEDKKPEQFIWIVRKCGTNFYEFYSDADLPHGDERVKFLFGTADRRHILTSQLSTLENSHEDAISFNLVTTENETIKEITRSEAVRLMRKHNERLL